MKSMNELMLHFLQDILYAEKLGVREMAKLAKAVDSQEVKELVLQHRDQTQKQVSRLEQVFEMFGKRPRGKTCAAMEGLVDEVHEAIEAGEKGPVLDAALIASAQAVDHYEIARYGAMVAWARQMGMDEAAEQLQQTLDEEKESDRQLNEIALRSANPEAERAEGGEEDEGEEEEKPAPRRRAAASSRKSDSKPAPAAKKPATRRSSSRK